MTLRAACRRGLPLLLALGAACAHADGAANIDAPRDGTTARGYTREDPFVTRPFRPQGDGSWIGEAIAYGPHRDGQRPGGPSPTKHEIREDLELMRRHWSLIRIYQATGPADSILQVIHANQMPLRVLLGVWIDAEAVRDSAGNVVTPRPEAAAANRAEVESAVRLAATYPDIVSGLSVGNETQIFWSSHRVAAPVLSQYVRELRARTSVPVTTADDYNFWNKPASHALAREIDFIMTHMHPLWNGVSVQDAPDWTAKTYADVRALHPGRVVVIGETGWATERLSSGEQGELMKAPADEEAQEAFCTAFAAWARRERVVTFFFEAFDENWKGSSDSGDAEKHWGFYRADRTPKRVIRNHG